MPPPSGFTTVSGSHFTDATGANIAYVIFFEPARSNGTPTSFHSGGTSAGQVSKQPVSVAAAAGTAFNINLADVSLTVPPFIGYNVWALDALSNKPLLSPGYFIQPTGPAFNFDAFIEGTTPTPTGASGGGGGGGGALPDLIFAAPDATLWRLARVDGALTGVAYSGILLAQTLYLNDISVPGNVYQLTMGNGGQIGWTLASGVTGVASVTVTDDDTEVVGVVTVSNGAEQWT